MSTILIVDDEHKMRHLLSIMLNRNGYEVDQAEDGQQALEMIQKQSYDLVITDIKMPRLDGHGLLKRMKEESLECPVIFITAFASVDSAVLAMQEGVVDYISKPFDEDRILFAVQRSLNVSKVLAENLELKQQIKKIAGQEEIVYRSEIMHQVVELASSVSRQDSTVMIQGESGTGKELLARFIHESSHRARQRFVPVNCAAIPSGLLESELFGYEKGAFTSADRRSSGKFEFASGGTLFLDEIGDLPLEAQAKLLRVLQEKKVQRVGGKHEIPVDVRIICATHQDLDALVSQDRFRSDLLYRINVFPIELPPLRERPDDISPLARHVLKKCDSGGGIELSQGAMKLLESYSWPGNVRELANVIERACILAQTTQRIDHKTLSFLKPEKKKQTEAENPNPGASELTLPEEGISLEDLELDLVRQALERSDHNQSAAARLLGLTRAKFRVLFKQYRKQARTSR